MDEISERRREGTGDSSRGIAYVSNAILKEIKLLSDFVGEGNN